MKKLKLNDQAHIPILGLGTWQLEGRECIRTVRTALELGYRHIDTADVYHNHTEIAEAIRQAGIARNKIFITTKIWWSDLHADELNRSFNRILTELQTEYVDLLLIHWPNREVPLNETLTSMDSLRNRGKVHTIGVSNFTIEYLSEAFKHGVEIKVNQVEFHPTFKQKELHQYCKKEGILLSAHTPFGQGRDLEHPIIREIADRNDITPAQVIISWLHRKNIVAIPKASSRKHLEQNLASIQVKLSKEDLKQLDSIKEEKRLLNPAYSIFN